MLVKNSLGERGVTLDSLFLNFLEVRSRKIAALSMNTLEILKSNNKTKQIVLLVALNGSCFNKVFFNGSVFGENYK